MRGSGMAESIGATVMEALSRRRVASGMAPERRRLLVVRRHVIIL